VWPPAAAPPAAPLYRRPRNLQPATRHSQNQKKQGSDFTLYSRIVGWVRYARDRAPARAGGHRPPVERRVVSVEPLSQAWWGGGAGGGGASPPSSPAEAAARARAEMDALVAARRAALARIRAGRAATPSAGAAQRQQQQQRRPSPP
jgi:hypothetical protein